MQILKIENLKIDEIADELKKGMSLVYPTETCYGLGADATNEKAVAKLFDIKKRQQNKTMLVIVPDIAMARQYIHWDENINEVANTYWPGPLTVVAKAKEDSGLASGVIAEDGTLAFRVTSNYLSSDLSRALGKPLVSTSANIAAMDSPYEAEAVINMYSEEPVQPDIIIDAGELPHLLPSTIVRLVGGTREVIRQGSIILS